MTGSTIVHASLLGLFVGGYLTTCDHFRGVPVEFLALTLIGVTLSLWTLAVLMSDVRGRLAAWLIFVGFLGCYYLKFYLIVSWPDLMKFAPLPMALSPAVLSPDNLIRVYEFITLAFGALCIAEVAFYSCYTANIAPPKVLLSRLAFRVAATTAIALSVLTSALVFHYGMVMGTAVTETLPFHLRGIVTLSRETLIPMLLLLLFQYAVEGKRRGLIGGTLVFILLYGLSMVVLEATKGGLGYTILMAALIPVLLGYTVRLRTIAGTILVLILSVAVFFPFVGAFRNERGSGLSLSESMELVHPSDVLSEDPWLPVKYLTMRLTGADALAVLVSADRRPLGIAFWRATDRYKWGVGGYMTEEIFQVNPELDELGIWAVAPSLLGFFFAIEGPGGIVVGMFFFTVGALFLWEWIRRRNFASGPAIEAVLLKFLLGALTDGTLQLLLRNDLTTITASASLVETIARSGNQEKPISTGPLPAQVLRN